MTTEYAAPARVHWAAAPKSPSRERFQPSAGALKISYVGCGVALSLGLIMGFALRPDYASGEASAGPRMVVAGAPSAVTYPDAAPTP